MATGITSTVVFVTRESAAFSVPLPEMKICRSTRTGSLTYSSLKIITQNYHAKLLL